MAEHLRAGVLGWPVSHSLSPRLHNHWLKQLGIDGEYTAVPVEPEHLRPTIRRLIDEGWQGCNLTIPHKEAALSIAHVIDETAQKIGAINTLVFKNGEIYGSNTDAYGFAENIRRHLPLQRQKAVILGAGGASRAVCSALHELGFEQIFITNRTEARAEELAEHFGAGFAAFPWEMREKLLEGANLLVNTTSLGLKGGEAFDLNMASLPVSALVTDIVYNPLVTPLLTAASARGNPTVDGLGMLIHQAVPGFNSWFGANPPVDESLKAMLLS